MAVIKVLTDDTATIQQVAEMLDVSVSTLAKVHKQLQNFPGSIGRLDGTKRKLYSRSAIKKWMSSHDVKAQTSLARRVVEEGNGSVRPYHRSTSAFNAMAVAFLKGALLPKKQKEQIEFRKMVARTTRPKTTRIQLVHDWMLEDGPRATHRRQA